jgi:putative hydrolase of the HAD superfamily
VERDCIRRLGYGLHSFAHALVQTFEKLAVEALTPALHETIHGFAHAIAEHPVEIRPGVPETLARLASTHRLIIMTKGDIAEQTRKVEGSGLKQHFSGVEIVAEKDVPTYLEIVAKHKLPKPHTWMVGNSPKSDINPALAAGLNAVFVPHDQTWVLEHEAVAEPSQGCKLIVVEQFAHLTRHF